MKFSRLVILLAIATFLTFGLPAAQSQNEAQAPAPENTATQTQRLNAIDQPMAPYPLEAVRRGIEGKVAMTIVVDANGKVSQATELSGPKELFPAALASVQMWQYEPPVSAPVTMTGEIGYGIPKECPGPTSDLGSVEGGRRLFDQNGKLAAVVYNDDYPHISTMMLTPELSMCDKFTRFSNNLRLPVAVKSRRCLLSNSLSPASMVDLPRRSNILTSLHSRIEI